MNEPQDNKVKVYVTKFGSTGVIILLALALLVGFLAWQNKLPACNNSNPSTTITTSPDNKKEIAAFQNTANEQLKILKDIGSKVTNDGTAINNTQGVVATVNNKVDKVSTKIDDMGTKVDGIDKKLDALPEKIGDQIKQNCSPKDPLAKQPDPATPPPAVTPPADPPRTAPVDPPSTAPRADPAPPARTTSSPPIRRYYPRRQGRTAKAITSKLNDHETRIAALETWRRDKADPALDRYHDALQQMAKELKSASQKGKDK